MVGIRNRTGRCTACRGRKIKCDLSRPACSRCERLDLKCEYHNPNHVEFFVNSSMTRPIVKAVDVLPTADRKKKPGAKETAFLQQGKAALESHHEKKGNQFPRSPNSDSVNRMQLFSTFAGLYLPEAAQGPTIPGQSPASWVHTLPDLTMTNSAYTMSVAALCVGHVGTCNHDPVLIMESRQLYGSALGELRKTISRRKMVAPEATLASIIMLSTYELFSGPSDGSDGWVSHVRGGSRILQILGSSIYQSPVGLQLFSRMRTIAIFDAFRTRKTSLLAGLDSQACATSFELPGLYCRLQDVMIQIPSIMETFDMLALSTNKASINKAAERTVLVRLLQISSSLHTQLQTWYENLRKQVNGQPYCVVPSLAHSPADDPLRGRVFPLAFHFPNLTVAQLLLIYWSTLIVLYRTVQDIHKRLGNRAAENLVTQLNLNLEGRNKICFERSYPSNSRIVALARNLCQSLEYCYRSKNGTLGLQSTVFTQWVAQDFYSSQPDLWRELKWCTEIGNMTAPDSRFDLHIMKLSSVESQ